MVSQREVADAAGVSTSTASLALNNHPRVSAKTRLHVQSVAERLGYVPNYAARRLVQERFGPTAHRAIQQIGVVSCVKDASFGSLNPTDMAFLNGVEQGIAARSGVLVYVRHSDALSARRIGDLARSGTVEGWIAFGFVDDDVAALFRSLGHPWVVLGDHGCSGPTHQVNMDFRKMGRLATEHLLELGHRQIGFIGTRMRFHYPQDILHGYHDAMADAGLPVPDTSILRREAGGDPREWLKSSLTQSQARTDAPTAYVYAEPGESSGMLAVCGELGIRLPEDLSLVFCEMADGLPVAPGISRVQAQAVESGRAAVSLLADVANVNGAVARQLWVMPTTVAGQTATVIS